MILYTFAHKGEALPFIQAKNFRPMNFPFAGVFENLAGDLLLITGEGLQRASERTAALCAVHHQKLKKVINAGVAGILEERDFAQSMGLELGKLVHVRTAYREPSLETFPLPSFQCHSKSKGQLPSPTGAIDCISAHTRIRDKTRSQSLSAFAPVVDMELWAVASAAQLFKIPVESYKLLIDYAGEDICLNHSSDHYLEYGQKIADYLLEFEHDPAVSVEAISSSLPTGFYFTATQGRQFQSLMKKSRQRWNLPTQALLEQKAGMNLIMLKEKNPKKRASLLIKELEVLLTSRSDRQWRTETEAQLLPLKRQKSIAHASCDVEGPALNLHISIRDEGDYQSLLSSLSAFPFGPFWQTINGEGRDP